MLKKSIASALICCGLPLNALADAPKVVVDIAPIHSLVAQVMDGVSQPSLLIPAEASPHSYSLKPSQAKALAEAQIIFWVGEELTPWLEKSMNNVAESAHKVALLDSSVTTRHEFREGATFEGHAHHDEEDHEEDHHDEHEGHADHKEHGHDDEHHASHHEEHDHGPGFFDRVLAFFGGGDHHDEHAHHDDHHDEHEDHHDEHGHEGVDPHAWLDPANAKKWIAEINKVLVKKDPENAQTYRANADRAIAELDQLISETNSQIKSLGKLKFVVFHDAYQYFEKRFDISAAGSISLSDAEDPSPARISEIRDTVQKLGVNCVFAEPQYDAGLVSNVFEGSTVNAIGIMDPLGAAIPAGKQHYPELIKGMVKSLSGCNK